MAMPASTPADRSHRSESFWGSHDVTLFRGEPQRSLAPLLQRGRRKRLHGFASGTFEDRENPLACTAPSDAARSALHGSQQSAARRCVDRRRDLMLGQDPGG